MLPEDTGFLFAAQQRVFEDKLVIGYKLFSFDTVTLKPITRQVYLDAKFGPTFSHFSHQIKEFLSCRALMLEGKRVFVVYPNGAAAIFNEDGSVHWHGDILYQEEGPADALIVDENIWFSFPKGGAIIRYSLHTMREELRIGGKKLPTFHSPSGLWRYGNTDNLLVCCPPADKIIRVNLTSYEVEDFAAFEEPVHQYLKIRSNEVVLLNSGIYKL